MDYIINELANLEYQYTLAEIGPVVLMFDGTFKAIYAHYQDSR